jgi:hypothetical protein
VCRTKSSSVCIFTEGGHSPSSPPQDYALDSTDEEGEPFWGGSRRVPTPLTFDPTDSLHMDFVVAAALLKVGLSLFWTWCCIQTFIWVLYTKFTWIPSGGVPGGCPPP